MNSRQTEGEPHDTAGQDDGRGQVTHAPRERKEPGNKSKS